MEIYPNRGGSFAASGNGNTNGIVWAVQDNNPGSGVLYAYDAGNLGNEFYNTGQAGSRDTLGVASKFSYSAGGKRKGICRRPDAVGHIRTATLANQPGD